ncbi:MAG: carboxypeptidase regulatory-like domain-containing protein, partial [Oscillospiraceae bacterium]|nr:carboxypeptidase regulatory-like domain-containing protein [Oscillospiraceae bacterium]
MATVSGRLAFDRARTSTYSDSLPGLANIPIVLQNTQTNAALTVLTDANGNYSFANVPNGTYRIVEAFGRRGVTSPGDFSAAVTSAPVTAAFPPISAVSNPPEGS